MILGLFFFMDESTKRNIMNRIYIHKCVSIMSRPDKCDDQLSFGLNRYRINSIFDYDDDMI